MRSLKRIVSVFALTMLLVPILAGAAFAQLGTDDPGVTVTDGGENCNGIIPTPGSENTVKRLIGGDLVPGGFAVFRIEYPVDPDDVGSGWEIVDCVLVGTGDDLKKYDVLDQKTFSGVVNNEFFTLTLHVDIPDTVPVGTSICNVAKTTEGPSAPQASNRKAGPACFVVGGAARVEKHDPQGSLLQGATFEISDCTYPEGADPAEQPIIVSPTPSGGGPEGTVVADEGFISFNGPSGATCVVTETIPPPGYTLPAPEDQSLTITIPVGVGDAALFVFVDLPLEPDIEVTKTCEPGAVGIGDTVAYTIRITNTGTEDLEGITVDDSLLGDLSSSFPDTLGVGDFFEEEFTRVVTADDPDPLPNTVTAAAVGTETQESVSDEDSCESDVLHEPGIDVSKSCVGSANVGDLVIYTITVENTGDEPLAGLTVVDSLLGDISNLFPDTLAVGESEVVQVERTVLPGDPDLLENVVTASGTGEDSGVEVSDEAACESSILRPAIDIEKTGPALAHVGDEVTYSLTVTNIGNTPLDNVTVSDPLCDATPLFTGGDANIDGLLDLSETWMYTCVHVIAAGDGDPVTNTATVTGADSLGTVVSAQDDHVVDIIAPAIAIAKTSDVPIAGPNQTVVYTMVITNAGDTPLHDVVVSDPLCDSVEFVGGDTNTDGILDLSEAWTYTCSAVLFEPVPLGTVVSPVDNTATASGTDVLGLTVTAQDTVRVLPVLAAPPQEPLPKTGTGGLREILFSGGLFLAAGMLFSVAGRRRLSPLAALGVEDGPVSRLVAARASMVRRTRARLLRRPEGWRGRSADPPGWGR